MKTTLAGPAVERLRKRLTEMENKVAFLESENSRLQKKLSRESGDRVDIYENIVSSTRDFISLVDKNYVYRTVNDAYLRYNPKRREEIVGRHVREIVGKDIFENVVKGKLDLCLAGHTVNYRQWFDYPTLGRRYIDVTYFPYIDKHGAVAGIVANGRDITERKIAETLLQEERYLEIKINGASGLGELFDICLEAAAKISGLEFGEVYLADESGGLDLAAHRGPRCATPDKKSHYDANSPEAILAGKGKPLYADDRAPAPYFVRLRKREGLKAFALLPAIYKNSQIGCMIVGSSEKPRAPHYSRKSLESAAARLASAVAAEKAAQDLKDSEERFRTLFEEIPAAVQGYGPDGTVRYWNRASENIYGYTKDEAIGKNLLDLIIPPGMRDEVTAAIAESAETGMTIPPAELELSRKDGSAAPVYSSHVVVRRKEKEPELYCLDIDLTEQKRLQRQLHQARKSEAIATLIGGIGHDFNNLLGVVIGNAELAAEDVSEKNPAHLNLREIITAGKRAQDIVKRLLTFNIKTGRKSRPINLTEALEKSLRSLRPRIPDNVDIKWGFETGEAMVLSDQDSIDRVMVNIVENAARAMENRRGSIEISLKIETLDKKAVDRDECLEEGKYAVVMVGDDSGGIAPEIVDRIFDPYFTTRETGKGSGMGLAVVHGIVKNHGGGVKVQNKYGTGASFHVYLPLLEEKPGPLAEQVKQESVAGVRKNILLVDDEKTLLNMTSQRLGRLGYNVRTARTPLEALEIFQATPDAFDLVITDMTMPQMPGTVLFEKIKRIRPDIPVVLSTGYSELIDEKKAMAKGAAAFLKKPFGKQEIAKVVEKALGYENSAQNVTR